MGISRPKGTADIFGTEAGMWRYIEGKIREVAALFGVEEIRTPMFENIELFVRSVGEATDIVSKEMYTTDYVEGQRRFALAPEGTAPAVRAYIENKIYNLPQPAKMYYLRPFFRAERPQKGRLRQFHSFGVEYFGSLAAHADAELISLVQTLLVTLGLENFTLRINSIGDRDCRKMYNLALLEFLGNCKDGLCDLCLGRMEKNPMRVLDCKNGDCKALLENAPVPLDHLSEESMAHFVQLQECLTDFGIPFVVDKSIVRGLDYYTRTVFEFTSTDLGAQATVCGGGRYDNLIEDNGGPPAGAVGFGMGIERLLIMLEERGKLPKINYGITVFVGGMGEAGTRRAGQIAHELRQNGVKAVCDLGGRSVKAQMKYADKLGARFSIVLGDFELESGKVAVKPMAGGDAVEICIEKIVEYFTEV